MINDLISSEPSERPSNGEPIEDRANCGVDDRPDRDCGDADRIGNSAVAAGSGEVGDDPVWASANSASKEVVVSLSSGYRDLDTFRATPGEKDGGGFTGVPSPGDVMDTDCS